MTNSPAASPTSKRVSKMASNQSVNLNHLLNFTLPPRQTHVPQSLPRRSRKAGTHQGVWNQERFVNAQYRFVMNPTGDYTVHFADPDIFFQWQDVMQVIIPRSSALASATANADRGNQDEGHTTCPICLSPPTAPRMTKCGHVYCFPCILRYLNTTDNKWARCPICTDSVNEKQLKVVKWFDETAWTDVTFGEPHAASSSSTSSLVEIVSFSPPREGLSLQMRLMQRPLITTLALPRSPTWPSDLVSPHQAPWHFLPDVYNFAKFMLATPTYLISDLTQNLDELSVERLALANMDDDLGVSFIDKAIDRLRRQIEEATALETPYLKDAVEKALRDQHEIKERVDRLRRRGKEDVASHPTEIPEEFLATRFRGVRDSAVSPSIPTVSSHHLPSPTRNAPRQRRNLNPPPPSTSTYYFYQAASGLPIFLHPLDIKILFSHFNGYASFPDTITIRVESLTEGSVNDDLRKRCKYLSHMPEGTDVVFAEADLEGVVGQEGLKSFEGAIKLRRTRRKEKTKKDDRARARAEERERREERIVITWSDSSRLVIPPAQTDIPEAVEDVSPPQERQPDVPGAWGARSFASALHSTPPVPGQRATRSDPEDEWDIDVAWHELEQRSGAGRKKRSNKLVVLGGAGGRRR